MPHPRFLPLHTGTYPIGHSSLLFHCRKEGQVKTYNPQNETQAENALLSSGNLLDIMDNLHGSYLRHSSEKTLKKVLPKSPTFPTPVAETYSVFKGFRVKDRV